MRIIRNIALSFLCVIAQQLTFAASSLLNGDISVEGTIVNAETGDPVSDVNLMITVARVDMLSESFRSSGTERRTVNGAYQEQCSSCSSLRIYFFADGYHSEMRTFNAQNVNDTTIVELRPVIDAVTLIHHSGRLVVDQDQGGNRILPLGPAPQLSTNLETARQQTEEQGEPLRYIQLLTELDESGAPQMLPRATLRDPRQAVSATLDFSSANGGVLPYMPSVESPRDIRRSMFLAPEEGYQSELELDTSGGDPVWFFVRIDGNYGRGRAFAPILEDTGSGRRLVVSIELFLNPDGSRNLETVE